MASDELLELTEAERAALGAQALEFVLDYFNQVPELPVLRAVDAAALRERLQEPLPETGLEGAAVLQACAELIAPYGRNNGHPRMFGYINSAPAFMGVLGDLLASALNQNVTAWRSAPAATEVEQLVINWIKELLGYDPAAAGLLLSGGSMANFTALVTALRAKTAVNLNRDGLRALPREVVIYASTMVHLSIPKAAELAGLGRQAVRLLEPREDFTLDPAALEAAIKEDLARGRQPICVVASAGDVNTGAIDPLEEVAEIGRKYNLWLHVDAAYGGFAALAPSARPLFAGLAAADSVTLDPHKWLFMPFDAGCLLVRDPLALRRAFAHEAEYIKVLDNQVGTDFAFWDYGPELSRRFRALKIWLTIKRHGSAALGAAIERNIQLAQRLGELIEAAPDFELLAPVRLSIVCFRYLPPEYHSARTISDESARAAEAAVNELNRLIVVQVQQGGQAYLSNAELNGRFALRACLVNYRTSEVDLPILLDTIRAAAAKV